MKAKSPFGVSIVYLNVFSGCFINILYFSIKFKNYSFLSQFQFWPNLRSFWRKFVSTWIHNHGCVKFWTFRRSDFRNWGWLCFIASPTIVMTGCNLEEKKHRRDLAHLIGLGEDGFLLRTGQQQRVLLSCEKTRQVEHIKGIYSTGSWGLNPVGLQLDRAAQLSS